MAPTRTPTSRKGQSRSRHPGALSGQRAWTGTGGSFPTGAGQRAFSRVFVAVPFLAERVSETLLRKSSERDLQRPGAMAELDQVQAATGPEEPAVATGHDQGLARVGASDGGSGEVASMEVDRHAEVDLRALAADLGDQPAARLSAHTPTVTVGEDVAEGGVVPGAEVAFVLGKRLDVDDVVRAELDA